jgi:hypothetical protein
VSEQKFWIAKQSLNRGQRLQLAMLRPERMVAPGWWQFDLRADSGWDPFYQSGRGETGAVVLEWQSLKEPFVSQSFVHPFAGCRLVRHPTKTGNPGNGSFNKESLQRPGASAEARAMLLGLTAFTFIPTDARLDSVTLQLRLPRSDSEEFPSRLWVTERTRGHILAAPLLFFGLPFPLQRSNFSHERVLELDLERAINPQ